MADPKTPADPEDDDLDEALADDGDADLDDDEDDEDGEDDGPLADGEAPEGAAVFPEIPPELGIHPLFLAMLHAYVFLEGSDPAVLNGAVAEEAMQYIVNYLQRLEGAELKRTREDLKALTGYAKMEKWPKQQTRFLQDFLREVGVEP
ncbi:MAG: hypothetical protein ACRC8S_18520 [Fimbriiglobus sp.]